MNGNNSWQQRTGQFAKFPKHDLGPVSQPPAGELFPVGQLMEDGGIPAPAKMPRQQIPQQYDQGQPKGKTKGKTIMGMPKDRFIALMGTIAQAFGGDSPSGRMGAGLINMADMMREERIERDKAQKPKEKKYAGDIKAFNDIYGRPPASAKELMEFKKATTLEKKAKLSQWDEFREARREKSIGEVIKEYKAIGGKEPTTPKGVADFEQIEGIWHKGFQHLNPKTKEYDFVPTRKAAKAEISKLTKVKPLAEEKKITPDKAREKLFNIAKFKSSLSKTGGWNETVFELMAQKDPEFAKRALSINSSKAEVNTTIKELENYYKSIVSGKPTAKKEETFDIEKQDARDAINQGIPADRVREMYKRRTGKELGF